MGAGVGAEHRPQPVVAALADQVEVEVPEGRPERPRVDHRFLAAAVPPERDPVAGRQLGVDQDLEHAGVVDAAHGTPVERGRGGAGAPRAHDDLVADAVDAEHAMRVAAGAGRQRGLVRGRIGLVRRWAHLHPAASASVRRTADAGMSTQSGRCASS
jgi:hypothetical protein